MSETPPDYDPGSLPGPDVQPDYAPAELPAPDPTPVDDPRPDVGRPQA